MAVLQEYKCPCCDGAIEFDSSSQNMKCPYCGTEMEMEAVKAYSESLADSPQEDMHWDTAAGSQWQEGEADGLRVYCCNTCGGEIITDETTGATECPYCGNPVIMTGQFAGQLRPDLVIPFKVSKKEAKEILQKHYKGKPLLPKVFKDQNHIDEVKGIYVPFWLFDTDADAHIRYKATRTRVWSDSQYNYTETRHYSVIRAGGIGFDNVPVDGSSKMDDTLMESIEPFDVSQGVDFQTAYLSGFLADKYDVDAEASIGRANERIRNSTESAFRATVHGYTTVVPVNTNIRLFNGRARYALYPVWLLNTRWRDKNFHFGINGQTGRIAGDLPTDWGAFWKWFGCVTAAVSAVALGISYLITML